MNSMLDKKVIFDPTLEGDQGYIRCSLCLSSFWGGYPSRAMHTRDCPDYEISTEPPYDRGYRNCVSYFSKSEITLCKHKVLGYSPLGFISKKLLEKYCTNLLSEDPKIALSCELSLAEEYLVQMREFLKKAKPNTGIAVGIQQDIEKAEIFITETAIKLKSF